MGRGCTIRSRPTFNPRARKGRREKERFSLRAPRCLRFLFLPAEDVSLAADVCSAAERSALRIDADGHDASAHRLRPKDLQLVAACRQRVADRRRDAILDLEYARLALVVVEGSERMQRVVAGPLDAFL